MAPPSNFVSMQEFLGLNEEAGQQMLDRAMAPGAKLRDEAMAATDARFSAAKGGQASYEASGERERKGLASYGEFMKGLQDPAARQALMEKVYGKGSVSALDSALVTGAGAGRIDAAQKEGQGVFRRAEEAGIRNENRAAMYEKQRVGYEQAAKDYAAAQSGRKAELGKVRDANEELRAKKDYLHPSEAGQASKSYGGRWSNGTYYTGAGTLGTDASGKEMTVAQKKKAFPQYGWGGAGTLRDAQGGGDY